MDNDIKNKSIEEEPVGIEDTGQFEGLESPISGSPEAVQNPVANESVAPVDSAPKVSSWRDVDVITDKPLGIDASAPAAEKASKAEAKKPYLFSSRDADFASDKPLDTGALLMDEITKGPERAPDNEPMKSADDVPEWEPATLADLKKIAIEDHLTMMMVLNKARQNNDLDQFFQDIYQKTKNKDHDHLALAAVDVANSALVKSHYSDLWSEVSNRVKARYNDPQWTASLVDEAGIDPDDYAAMPEYFRKVMAATAEFEVDFPDKDKPSLAQRLKASKDTLVQGLSSETGQKTLNYLGWAISIATGGVALKLGIKGVKHAAEKLASNASVKGYMEGIVKASVDVMKKNNVPTDKIGAKILDLRESSRYLWDNKAVRFTGKALGVIAIGLVLNEMDIQGLFSEPGLGSFGADMRNDYGLAGAVVETPIRAVTEIARSVIAVADSGVDLGVSALGMDGSAEKLVALGDSLSTGFAESWDVASSSLKEAATGWSETYGVDPELKAGVDLVQHDDVAYEPSILDMNNPSAQMLADTTAPESAPNAVISDRYTVSQGDTLWDIARQQIIAAGGEASSQNIEATWNAIYEANKGIIGANPDLIFPNQTFSISADMLHGVEVNESVKAPEVSVVQPTEVAKIGHIDEFERMEDLIAAASVERPSEIDLKSASVAVVTPKAKYGSEGFEP